MRRRHALAACVLALWAASSAVAQDPAAPATTKPLWQIGQSDNATAEFALAPADFAHFNERFRDPVFLVGVSEPGRDWPYFQPGPRDGDHGGRPHGFTIVFSLKARPTGECRLVVDLVGTHMLYPPTLEFTINGGKPIVHQTPRGKSDGPYFGRPAEGNEHVISLPIPADSLHDGPNEIRIRTASGSMIFYDAIRFEAPPDTELAPTQSYTRARSATSPPVLVEQAGKLVQPVRLEVFHVGEPVECTLAVEGGESTPVAVRQGEQVVEFTVPAAEAKRTVAFELREGTSVLAKDRVAIEPVRRWEVYLLPHSHVDIGYTALQTDVEKDQWRFLDEAIAAARRTADYPVGSRYKWNSEVLWAVDSYLKQAPPEKQKELLDAVKRGWIGLDGLYCHELAALCRPEELARMTDCAVRLVKQHGVTIDAAMATDVAGYTWGIVPVMAESGMKYLSLGPNSNHRIGFTRDWNNRPFYWLSPSGREKVLCWQTGSGYEPGFRQESQLLDYLRQFEREHPDYPYDVLYFRYCRGDNAGPDPEVSEWVRKWNAGHAYPKLVIATTSELFHRFEERYADKIPTARGDFTPYWEDGAASTAHETAVNRAAAERLAQAETLWALLKPNAYPDQAFYEAWRNALLYDEHTWGGQSYIRGGKYPPGSEGYETQWKVKRAFALDADARSRKLLDDALAERRDAGGQVSAVDAFNTCAWPRSDLVTVPADWKLAGETVRSGDAAAASQRLVSGELAFLAADVPALSARRFTFHPGGPPATGAARAEATTLSNQHIEVTVDEKTGAIARLVSRELGQDLVDRTAGPGLNDLLYVRGKDPSQAARNGPVRIRREESGPLVASLVVESDSPDGSKLERRVRLIDGLPRVELIDIVDKKAIPLADLLKDDPQKEGFYYAFAFHVPNGVMRIDTPWAVVRPEEDQLPGACKNWFTVQRWVDISNGDYGATWATVDSPMIQVGRIAAQPEQPHSPEVWRRTIEPTQTFYAYVMNNYWTTNYQHDQPGVKLFRYAIRPHRAGSVAEAARFGAEQSRPLVVVPVAPDAPPIAAAPFSVRSDSVIVETFKPSRDGKAWIVRLYNPDDRDAEARFDWGDARPGSVWLTDLTEDPKQPVTGAIEVPAKGLVCVRVNFKPTEP
ncbi:MAG: polysaccharide lyase family protein [Planctomycetia bacterium]|nr:polysaccharide lyase family protein [Planctomycetia bacterium]